jgi:hypothetical protein
MKTGREAIDQYAQLADALRQADLGWIVDEVDDDISRGKSVALQDLDAQQQSDYEGRLEVQAERGVPVARARITDQIGVPYDSDEVLTHLVAATERVVNASIRSALYVAEFAEHHEIRSVVFEQPVGVDPNALVESRRAIPMDIPRDQAETRLRNLDSLLNDVVLD